MQTLQVPSTSWLDPRRSALRSLNSVLGWGLTQQELAERADIHRSYLSTLERGKSTEAMRQIFDALRTLGLEVVIRPR